MNTSSPITSDDLQAFVDNELTADRRRLIEAYLSDTPEAAATVADWTRQKDMIAALYGGVAEAAVPDRLDTQSLLRRRRERLLGWRRVAAAFAMLAIGVAGGWEAARYRAGSAAAPDPLVASAMDAHQLYAGDTARPVEIRAEDGPALKAWLSHRLNRTINLPNLQAFDLRLIGGRLLPNEAGAAAQLMYEDEMGRRVTIYVAPAASESDIPFAHIRDKQLEAVFWSDDAIHCAVVGNLPLDRLQGIAKAAYRQLV